MPYYSTDNFQCWIRACIEERFDDLEDDEKLDYIERVTDRDGLREECQDMIESVVDMRGWNNKMGTMPFVSALMNTIDFEVLLQEVSDDMEEEKKSAESTK
jgi:hypothetical protein